MAAVLYKAGYAKKILLTGMVGFAKQGYYQSPRSLFFLKQKSMSIRPRWSGVMPSGSVYKLCFSTLSPMALCSKWHILVLYWTAPGLLAGGSSGHFRRITVCLRAHCPCMPSSWQGCSACVDHIYFTKCSPPFMKQTS